MEWSFGETREPRGNYVLIPNGREEENSTVPSRVCPFERIEDGIVQTALIRLICYPNSIATVVLQGISKRWAPGCVRMR